MPAESALRCQLDHLVVCSHTVGAGVDWFERKSGIRLPAGGSHPLMATHNHLSALSESTFLEIIAADPQAPQALRSRWFNLDDKKFQRALKNSPRLTTWVVGTRNLTALIDAAAAAGIDAGEPVDLTRGDLKWQIALRADGTLACDGVFPILIQWPHDVNPVASMRNQGLRLNNLQLQHPQAEHVSEALQAIGADHLADVRLGDALLQARLSAGNLQFDI